MKIKIVGFKVGESRPTANRTAKSGADFRGTATEYEKYVGAMLIEVLRKSDFISIRKVSEP